MSGGIDFAGPGGTDEGARLVARGMLAAGDDERVCRCGSWWATGDAREAVTA